MKRIKIILVFLILISITGISLATTDKISQIEKSAEFEKWENLSEGERENSIQPPYTDLSIEDSMKKSEYNKLISVGDSELGSYYKTTGCIVKNQQHSNLCWAFSFTSALESSISKKYNKTSTEFSPLYIDYNASNIFTKHIGDGAMFEVALGTATSKYGSEYESNMPFSTYYNEETNSGDDFYLSYNNVNPSTLQSRIKINKTHSFANIFKSYSDGTITYKDSAKFIGANTYTDEQVNAIRQQIKNSIKEHGAVASYTYLKEAYYNADKSAFFCDSILNSDHAITIVGWDDNFSKTNFKDGKQPIHDGAYIVLNSWGTDFGENGYYYISYDDAHIEQYVYCINDVQDFSEEEKDYNNLYEYDELGQSLWFTYINDDRTDYSSQGYLANTFTRKDTSKDEYLTEVGVYVPITEGIEIYVDHENADKVGYELVGSYTGSNALEPGYHSLKLANPIKIDGDSFAVIVKYVNSNGAMCSVECNLEQSGISDEEDYYSKATANLGESYISNDGSNWTDINQYKLYISSTEYVTLQNTNACIKAFTSTEDAPENPFVAVTGVEISEESITLNEGNTANVVATVSPSNATNKNITWTSSDESIATIENGVITAVSEGTAVITVTTVDGSKTDSCTVTVIKNETPEETVSVTGVKLSLQLADGVSLALDEGETYTLNAIVEPSNASNKNVTWTSSDESVATVKNGVITAVSEGTAVITVTTVDGNKTASINVSVSKKDIESTKVSVESVSLNKTKLNMEVGDRTNLVATINPSNASDKSVTWTSSNKNVATVSETGIIKAIAEGKTTITVITEDGNKTASCEVTVTKKTNTADDIYKSDEDITPSKTTDTKTSTDTTKTNTKDTTTSENKLPNTGLRVFRVIITGIALIGIISYIRTRKYKDIK